MNIVRSSASFLVAQVLYLAIGLLSSIIVSRWLGPEGRGIVALATVVTGLGTAIATFGFTTSYAYLGGKMLLRPSAVVGSAIVVALGLGAVTIALLVGLSGPLLATVLRGMTQEQLLVTALSVPFAYVTIFLLNFLTGAGRAPRAAWMQLIGAMFAAAVLIGGLVLGHQGVTGAVVIVSGTTIIVAGWTIAIVAAEFGVSFSNLAETTR